MALDRQKILNELGSVMTQLKNADCGCMGKLFGGGTHNTHGGGHGGHLNHHSCPSEPFLPRLNLGTMNPAKLYTETFNYLNKNLMQPTIKEVYDELKGINNMNTIMNNNPSHNQAGTRPSPAAALKEQMLKDAQMNAQKTISPNMAPNQIGIPDGKMIDGNINNMSDVNSNVGVKGDAITNMTHVSNPAMISHTNMQGGMTTENVANPRKNSGMVPVTNPISTGFTPSNSIACNNGQYVPQRLESDLVQMTNKKSCGWGPPQYDNNSAAIKSYPGQQVAPSQSQHMKFNQMFPGLKGFGENRLRYDPMAVAFQMNPANTEKLAVEPSTKYINNNNHRFNPGVVNIPDIQPDNSYQTTNLIPGETTMNQELPNQDPVLTYNQQNVKSFFSNEPKSYMAEVDYNKLNRDTIQPIETTMSNPNYNTIGQPVTEYLTPESSIKQTTPTPYTTRHYWNDPSFYSSVKNTESKTSLMGTPGNAMGNRNQLNHLYNQYKGSQSYTHQAVKPPVSGSSMSVDHLNTANVRHGNVFQLTPIEKLGGDTVTCNALSFPKPEPVTLGGDVVTTPKVQKYHSEHKEPHVPKPAASRNGLQDVAFTTYNTAPAWSFYRNSRSSPFPAS
ncbi:hypothetical protein EVAR_78300_1 [Eumeta japonica]|uniref:Uncharacterized protein n=1 Tax=Eumeta variegata TaxID=151549 RepID=A0A4C1T3Z2_EUMVA|nr:hypothetical protein EVAR_78300_1 [Eumeta japonica]